MTEKKYLETVKRLGGVIEPVCMIHFPKLRITTAQQAIDVLTVMRYSGGDLTNDESYDIDDYDILLDKIIEAIKRGLDK